jgi:hypothetical protein
MQIFQKPNIPITLWFFSTIISLITHGIIYYVSTTVSFIAIIIWSYLELSEGINWFRKILGLVVLIVTALALYMQISH